MPLNRFTNCTRDDTSSPARDRRIVSSATLPIVSSCWIIVSSFEFSPCLACFTINICVAVTRELYRVVHARFLKSSEFYFLFLRQVARIYSLFDAFPQTMVPTKTLAGYDTGNESARNDVTRYYSRFRTTVYTTLKIPRRIYKCRTICQTMLLSDLLASQIARVPVHWTHARTREHTRVHRRWSRKLCVFDEEVVKKRRKRWLPEIWKRCSGSPHCRGSVFYGIEYGLKLVENVAYNFLHRFRLVQTFKCLVFYDLIYRLLFKCIFLLDLSLCHEFSIALLNLLKQQVSWLLEFCRVMHRRF